MSSAREILEQYHAKVTFPITTEKIEAAGYDVTDYLSGIIGELKKADDVHDPRVQKFLRRIHLMELASKIT